MTNLSAKLPNIIKNAKAKNTQKKYEYGFKHWCSWANNLDLNPLPASEIYVSLYLVSLFQTSNNISKIDEAIYSIAWAHEVAGFVNPCKSELIKQFREGAIRLMGHRPTKKEPITPEILEKLWNVCKTKNFDLMEMRNFCMCIIGYAGFLRFSELVHIKRSDIVFCDAYFIITVQSSKTDKYGKGSEVFISQTNTDLCPLINLKLYLSKANIDDHSQDFIFRQVSFCKSSSTYKLRNSGPLSYTRAREILLDKLESIGLDKSRFGLHSLRSGGATFAANMGVVDRIFKKHGRWASENAKDGYVRENVKEKLSVSQNLGRYNLYSQNTYYLFV